MRQTHDAGSGATCAAAPAHTDATTLSAHPPNMKEDSAAASFLLPLPAAAADCVSAPVAAAASALPLQQGLGCCWLQDEHGQSGGVV